MPEGTAEVAAAMSRAATGLHAPNSVTVRRLASMAVARQVGVLVLVYIYAAAIIYVLAWNPMPKPDGPDSAKRIWFIGWTGLTCGTCMALVALSYDPRTDLRGLRSQLPPGCSASVHGELG